jgi:glycine cleavage system H protein
VGITDYAQEQLGDIVYLEVPETDKKFLKGDVLAEIENVKSVNNIMAPASGHILEVNDHVLETPEIIKNDPFGKGWILKYNVADINDLSDLMDHQQYTLFLGTLDDK